MGPQLGVRCTEINALSHDLNMRPVLATSLNPFYNIHDLTFDLSDLSPGYLPPKCSAFPIAFVSGRTLIDLSCKDAINKWVVDIRKFVSPTPTPVLVQRRFVDVDGFLHASFEVTWFLVQNTHFVQVHVVARGLDVYLLGYFWRGGAWVTMFKKYVKMWFGICESNSAIKIIPMKVSLKRALDSLLELMYALL